MDARAPKAIARIIDWEGENAYGIHLDYGDCWRSYHVGTRQDAERELARFKSSSDAWRSDGRTRIRVLIV